MADRWTASELTTLQNNLVEGITLNHIVQLLVPRTDGAIIQQAQKRGYRIEKSKDDSAQRFYKGVPRRNRRSSSSTVQATPVEDSESLTVSSTASVTHAEPPPIIANMNIEANNLAVKFLLENNLRTDSKMIYEQSLLVLKGML